MRMGVSATLGVSLAVAVRPSVGFASSDVISLVGRLVDGEVQRHHGVAARSVGERVGRRIVTFGIGVTVYPSVAVAGCLHVGEVTLAVDGEVQGHHGIASRRIGGSVSCCIVVVGVGVTVYPSVAVASNLSVCAGGAVVDGEVQCHHRVATRYIGGGVGCRVVAFGEGGVVPSVAVAGGHGLGAVALVVDGEVQRHHGVATCRISGGVGCRVVAFGEGGVVPSVAVAGGHGLNASSAVVDSEVQRHHRVATCCIGSGVGCRIVIIGIGDTIYPSVAVAGSHGLGAGAAVVDGQMQRHHTVHTARGYKSV